MIMKLEKIMSNVGGFVCAGVGVVSGCVAILEYVGRNFGTNGDNGVRKPNTDGSVLADVEDLNSDLLVSRDRGVATSGDRIPVGGTNTGVRV